MQVIQTAQLLVVMLCFILGCGPLDMSHEWKRLVRENTTAELPTQSSTSLLTSPHRRLYGLVPVALPHHSLLVSCDYFNYKHLAGGSKTAESRIRRRHAVRSGPALTSLCCLSQCETSVQSDEDTAEGVNHIVFSRLISCQIFGADDVLCTRIYVRA